MSLNKKVDDLKEGDHFLVSYGGYWAVWKVLKVDEFSLICQPEDGRSMRNAGLRSGQIQKYAKESIGALLHSPDVSIVPPHVIVKLRKDNGLL